MESACLGDFGLFHSEKVEAVTGQGTCQSRCWQGPRASPQASPCMTPCKVLVGLVGAFHLLIGPFWGFQRHESPAVVSKTPSHSPRNLRWHHLPLSFPQPHSPCPNTFGLSYFHCSLGLSGVLPKPSETSGGHYRPVPTWNMAPLMP